MKTKRVIGREPDLAIQWDGAHETLLKIMDQDVALRRGDNYLYLSGTDGCLESVELGDWIVFTPTGFLIFVNEASLLDHYKEV